MIYGITFQQKDRYGNISETSQNALISGLNEANALDILSKYCEYGIGKITYFRMISSLADGNVILLDENELSQYFQL